MRSRAETDLKMAQDETANVTREVEGVVEKLQEAKVTERTLKAQIDQGANDLQQANDRVQEITDLLVMTGEAHATGPIRIASIRLDPLALEARLRRVVPSITVQEGANHLYVVYAEDPLDEADFNRVRAEFQGLLDMDRT